MPIAPGEGNYVADVQTLTTLINEGRVVFRYCDPTGLVLPTANPNGSMENIAGIVNEGGNVLGLMPHPERVVDPLLGSTDGKALFESLKSAIAGVAR